MPWLVFALAAPFLYSTSNLADKHLVSSRIKNPASLTVLGGFVAGIAGIIILAFIGLPKLPGLHILLLLTSGILSELALLPHYKAMQMEDASRIIPLYQLAPLLTLILSFTLLSERLTQAQLLGFVFTLVGAIALSLQKGSGSRVRVRRAVWYVLLASFLYASTAVLFKYVVVDTSFWNALVYELFGAALGSVIIFLWIGPAFLKEARRLTGSTWSVISGNEIVYLSARLCSFYAISLAPIALVSVIGGLQPFFMLVFGYILSRWFPAVVKEDIRGKTLALKVGALAILFVGVWLINR